jgi:hypothetical protein
LQNVIGCLGAEAIEAARRRFPHPGPMRRCFHRLPSWANNFDRHALTVRARAFAPNRRGILFLKRQIENGCG